MDRPLENKFISTRDASELSGYHADYLGRLCREGKIAGRRVGRSWLIDRGSLRSFIRSQEVRKRENAQELSRTREREYKAAHVNSTEPPHVLMGSAFSALSKRNKFAIRQTVLAVATLAIVGAGAQVAHSGLIEKSAHETFVVANGAHDLLAAGVQTLVNNTKEHQSHVVQNGNTTPASHTVVLTLPETASIAKTDFVFDFDSITTTSTQALADHTSNTSHASIALRASMHTMASVRIDPVTLAASVIDTGVHTPFALVNADVALTNTILDTYQRATTALGASVLSSGIGVRDTLQYAPVVSSKVIALYEQGIDAWVVRTPTLPVLVTARLIALGDVIAQGTQYTITQTPIAYEQSTRGIAYAIPRVLDVGARNEVALGNAVNGLTQDFFTVPANAVTSTVYAVADTNQAVAARIPQLVTNSAIVWNASYDVALGVVGKTALAVEYVQGGAQTHVARRVAVMTPVLPNIQRSNALVAATGSLSPSWADTILSAIYTFFVDISHGIELAFSELFKSNASTSITQTTHSVSHPSTVVHTATTSTPSVVSTSTSRTTRVIQNGSTTVVQNFNSYPVLPVASTSYIDSAITLLERSIDNRFGSLHHDSISTLGSVDISNSTFSDGTITNSDISGGTIAGDMLTISGSTTLGSTLSTGTTTVNGLLTVTGDIAIGGTLTANTLSVSNLSSNSAIIAPIFTATSTSATSTLPYLAVSALQFGSDYLTDFTGAGLTVSNGALSIATSTLATAGFFVHGGNALGTTAILGTTDNNALSLITNGTSRIYVDANGNVAIGKTSATNKLEVVGSIIARETDDGFNAVSLVAGASSGNIQVNSAGSATITLTGSNGNVSANTFNGSGAGVSYFMGNLGIGTTTPAVPLDVYSSSGVLQGSFNGAASSVGLAITNRNAGGFTWNVYSTANTSSIGGGKFDIARGSNNYFTIDGNGGNVGIGTTSPQNTLHVSGSTSGQVARISNTSTGPQLLLEDVLQADASTPFFYLGSNGGSFRIGSANRSGLVTTGSTDRLTITGAGNVGIGTIAPHYQLEVGSTSAAQIDLRNLDATSAAVVQGTVLGSLTFSGTDTVPDTAARTAAAIRGFGDAPWTATASTNKGALGFFTQDDASVGLLERLHITSTGNVGIGTTTPDTSLDVVKTGAARLWTTTAATVATFERSSSAAGSAYISVISGNTGLARLQLGDTDSEAQGLVQYDNSTNALSLWTSATQKVTLTSAGQLGISTTSPQSLLAVSGNATIGADLNTVAPTNGLWVEGLARFGLGGAVTLPDGAGGSFTPQVLNTQTSGIAGIGTGVVDGTNNRRAALFVNNTSSVWGLSMTYGSGSIPFVVNNAGTEQLRIDTSGRVGIGTTSPLARLHVATSNSGATAVSSSADEFVIESGGVTGMTILSGAASTGNIFFGNSSSQTLGRIVYDNGTNNLSLWTTATQRLTIDGSGNVGIGTTTPNARLTVTSSGANGLNLDADLADATQSARLFFSTGTAGQAAAILNAAGSLQFRTGATAGASTGTNRWLITSGGIFQATGAQTIQTDTGNLTVATAGGNGNILLTPNGSGSVGVGTTTPGTTLAVQGSFSVDSGAASTNTSIFLNQLGVIKGFLGIAGVANGVITGTAAGDTVLRASSGTAQKLVLSGGSTADINVTQAGNVGIGTTSPLTKLDISASDTQTSVIALGNASMSVVNTNTTANNFSALNFRTVDSSGNTTSGSGIVGVFTSHGASISGDLAFFTKNSGTLAEKMRILANGNVGIGTSTPITKLSLGAGQFSVPIGTVAAPSLTFNDDLDTGFYSTASDTIAFATGGVLRGTIGNAGLFYNGVAAFGGTAINANNLITAASNVQDPTAAATGATFSRTLVLTSTNAQQITGGNFQVSSAANNFNYTGTLRGGQFQVQNGNIATVSNVRGGDFLSYNTDVGTVTNSYAGYASTQNLAAAGTITNAYNYYVGTGFNNGTINNWYGLYVNTPPAASSSYAVYTNGTTPSFFGGNVYGGTTNIGGLSLLELSRAESTATLGSSTVSLTLRNAETSNGVGSRGYEGINFAGSSLTSVGNYAGIYGVVTGSGAGGQIGALTFGTKANITDTALTERLRIDSNGNVGIGSTSPSAKLTVLNSAVSSAIGQGAGRFGTTASGVSTELGSYTGGYGYVQAMTSTTGTSVDLLLNPLGSRVAIGTTTETAFFSVKTNSTSGNALILNNSSLTNLFTVQNTGNVGIGISPLTTGFGGPTLQIPGTGALYISNAASLVTTAGGQNGVNVFNNFANNTGLLLKKTSAGSGDYLAVEDSSANTQFVIKSSGNVGIGTTSPVSLLSAQGTDVTNGQFRIGYDINNYVPFKVSAGGNLTINPSGSAVSVGTIANTTSTFSITRNNAVVGGLTTANGVFSLFGGVNAATHLTIDSSGNAGVGSTTPWGQLSVNPSGAAGPSFVIGSSTATSFIVSNTGNVGIGTTSPMSALAIGSGQILVPDGSGSAPSFGFASKSNSGIFYGSTIIQFVNGGVSSFGVGNNGLRLPASNAVGWCSTNAVGCALGTSMDLTLFRDAANTLALRNGLNAQAFNIYATSTNSSNYERLSIDTSGSVITFASQAAGSGTARNFNFSGGNVGLGTTTPSAQLTTTGTIQFAGFGAGSLQTDASGNVTVSSDERLKNVNGSYTRGLADIAQIDPILYHWNSISGLDQNTLYAGFSAQNVKKAIPEAVDTDPRGYLSLQDRPILAAAVNAIKELNNRTITLGTVSSTTGQSLADIQFDLNMIASTTASSTASTTPGALRFANSFWKNVIARVGDWIGNSGNGLAAVFAGSVHAKDTICVDDQCLTKEDIRALIQVAHQNGAATHTNTDPSDDGNGSVDVNGGTGTTEPTGPATGDSTGQEGNESPQTPTQPTPPTDASGVIDAGNGSASSNTDSGSTESGPAVSDS